MHTLPFGAVFTESLIEKLRDLAKRCVTKEPDSLPSVTWVTVQKFPEEPADCWGLVAFSRTYMQSTDIFTVDGVVFHISGADQARASGHALAWRDGTGIVEINT